jgi:ELWxxDGT repeat protein
MGVPGQRGIVQADPPFVPRAVRPPVGSHPRNLCHVNGVLYYAAYDGVHGEELWRSDGTEAGTYMLKDIRDDDPGDFARGCRPHDLTAVGELLFFIADDGPHGDEIWISDGTEGGTRIVKDLEAGPVSPICEYLMSFKGLLFFVGHVYGYGAQLWRSDGTAEGTVIVKYIDGMGPKEFAVIGETLFFFAHDWDYGIQLWKTDGSEQGTVRISNVDAGGLPRGFLIYPQHLTSVGEMLFFLAFDFKYGLELWTSDGTHSNTYMVKDVHPDPNFAGYLYPASHAAATSELFFYTFEDGQHGLELWASDGTAANTRLMRDIVPGPNFPAIDEMIAVGGTLFFACDDRMHGYELWKSDGSEPNTVMVRDIDESVGGYPGSVPADLTAWKNLVFFFAHKIGQGRELWRSDGTEAGTLPVSDEDFHVSVGTAYRTLTNANGTLFFRGGDSIYGNELWCYRPDFGDIDEDGEVNFLDYAAFGRQWGTDGCNLTNDWCDKADITDYGRVNTLDLAELADHWLEAR